MWLTQYYCKYCLQLRSMGWGSRVLRACDCSQIQLSFISIHQNRSLWSIDSPTLLTLSSSSVIIVTHQPLRPHNLIIINLAHLIHLIINLCHRSHIANRISLLHLTVTNNSLVTLTISLSWAKSLSLSVLFSQLAAIATNRYWRKTS